MRVKTNLEALLSALYVHLDDNVFLARTLIFIVLGQPARATPAWHDELRPMDGTLVPCCASRTTVERSDPSETCGYGRDTSHHRFHRGSNSYSSPSPRAP